MKMTLSKAQWEMIGKKAGWINESQSAEIQKRECPECHGKGVVEKNLKNLGTLEYDYRTITCPSCRGKGHIDKSDHDAYLHSIGVKPCPYEND